MRSSLSADQSIEMCKRIPTDDHQVIRRVRRREIKGVDIPSSVLNTALKIRSLSVFGLNIIYL